MEPLVFFWVWNFAVVLWRFKCCIVVFIVKKVFLPAESVLIWAVKDKSVAVMYLHPAAFWHELEPATNKLIFLNKLLLKVSRTHVSGNFPSTCMSWTAAILASSLNPLPLPFLTCQTWKSRWDGKGKHFIKNLMRFTLPCGPLLQTSLSQLAIIDLCCCRNSALPGSLILKAELRCPAVIFLHGFYNKYTIID